MKNIYVCVIRHFDNNPNKKYAYADTIHCGQDILPILANMNASHVCLCETRKQADEMAQRCNKSYKKDGVYAF